MAQTAGSAREQRIERALLRLSGTLSGYGDGGQQHAGAAAAAAASSSAAVPHHAAGGASTHGVTTRAVRRCRPWSRDDMLERARSFRIGAWGAPPSGLRPLECARHGWFTVAPETLGCSCGARLVFPREAIAAISDADALGSADADEPVAAAHEQALTVRVVESLRTGHKPECPWRDSACPATFLAYPPMEPKDLLAELRRRAASLAAVPPHQLPRVRSLDDLGVSSLERGALWAALGVPTGAGEDSPQVAAAALALFGWTWDGRSGGPEPSAAVLSCELCFRSVGCWQFRRHGGNGPSPRPQKRPRTGSAASATASSRSSSSDGDELVDPREEHRVFCPCIVAPDAQGKERSAQALPGFQVVLDSLLGPARNTEN